MSPPLTKDYHPEVNRRVKDECVVVHMQYYVLHVFQMRACIG